MTGFHFVLLLASLAACHAKDPYPELTKLIHRQVAESKAKRSDFNLTETVGIKFQCTGEPSPTVPESVHTLRPGDVKVVAAVGDSITAGFGAKATTIFGIATEYRGISWSIGGDQTLETVATLPNVLKIFNPSIKGFSVGTGGPGSSNAGLNKAVSGAIARDIPQQVEVLVEQMRNDPEIDFDNDWKVITLWIGGNDLCRVCDGGADHQPEYYTEYVKQGLDILHYTVPRAFVNLVQMLDVGRLNDISGKGLCGLYQPLLCGCSTSASKRQLVSEAVAQYQANFNALISSGRYDTRDDFTVAVQPFFTNTQVPRKPDNQPDTSYFAPDCFHFSAKAHAAAAVGLWNNMLEPEGEKELDWREGEGLLCPTEERPYIATTKNSHASKFAGQSVANGHKEKPKPSSTTPAILAAVGGLLLFVTVACVVYVRKRHSIVNVPRQQESTEQTHLLPVATRV